MGSKHIQPPTHRYGSVQGDLYLSWDLTGVAGNITLRETDRIVFILNDYAVWGKTRLQKYGFLLSELYEYEMRQIHNKHNIKFYDDWKPHWYGPFSQDLKDDLDACIENQLVAKLDMSKMQREKPDMYQLAILGRIRLRQLLPKVPEMQLLAKAVGSYQKVPYYTLLNRIYSGWPGFATKSRIRDDVAARAGH